MGLREEIQTMVREKLAGIPQETKRDMAADVERLAQTGLAQTAVREGSTAPGFNLPDAKGGTVSLAERLLRGPVVLSFYRGPW
jgi:hypothetical protein